MTQIDPFDPQALIAALNRHGVRYVVIGGIAGGVQGAVWATTDLDICYARGPSDHERLAAALAELKARPVDLPSGLRVRLDARALRRGETWTLLTDFGRLDLMGEPAPGLDYETLSATARSFVGQHETYLVASLEDLITMKRAAGRAKDRAHIELIQAVREELQR